MGNLYFRPKYTGRAQFPGICCELQQVSLMLSVVELIEDEHFFNSVQTGWGCRFSLFSIVVKFPTSIRPCFLFSNHDRIRTNCR